ncbi:MAG: thioredoxin [Bacteroidetes bacterium]|nr:thioredoxin [Bacteroidota bacterium]
MKLMTSIFLLALTFAACTGQSPTVKNLNADEFEKGIKGKNIQLLDVRTPGEYSEKHLAHSKNINLNEAGFETQLNKMDKSKPLYVYCLAGSRSAQAAELATKNGFKEIYNLEGGINAWIGGRKPVETSSGEAPDMGMSFDDYLNQLKAKDKLVLVDFNAVWCGPCKILKPIVHRVIKNNNAKAELLEIDVDKNPEISRTMHISGIPLLVLYKQGKEVWRAMGLTDEGTIEKQIQKFSK